MEEKDYKIFLSPAATEEIKKQISKRNTLDVSVRLGIRGAGCSGYSYVLLFDDDSPSKKDILFEIDGIKILTDVKSIIYLNGCTLDWEKTLKYQGFKFINPNEAAKCGCGTSFSI